MAHRIRSRSEPHHSSASSRAAEKEAAESNYHAFFISEPEDADGKAMEANDQKYVGGASEHNASAHTMQDMPPVLLAEDLWPDIICFVVDYYAEPFGDPCDLRKNGHFHYWCSPCAIARKKAAENIAKESECEDFEMREEELRDAKIWNRIARCEMMNWNLMEERNRCVCEDCGGCENCEDCAAVRTLRAVSTKFQSMTDDDLS